MKTLKKDSNKESKMTKEMLNQAVQNLDKLIGGKGQNTSSVDFIVEEYGGV